VKNHFKAATDYIAGFFEEDSASRDQLSEGCLSPKLDLAQTQELSENEVLTKSRQ
jgi:hypothetical protein